VGCKKDRLKALTNDEGERSDPEPTPTARHRTSSLRKQVVNDAKEDAALEARLEKARQAFEAQHSTQPHKAEIEPPMQTDKAPPVTGADQTAKLKLAQSGSAFSVATIAQLANRPSEEVVINLH
jgi:hypothetical protein